MGIFLKIISSVFGFVWQVIIFPFKRIASIIVSMSEDLTLQCFIKVVLNILAIVGYFAVICFIYMAVDTWLFVKLGGVIGMLAKEEIITYDGPAEFPNTGIVGGGSFGGQEFEFDFDKLPENVALPSNYYQAGSVRQRAELLILVQEICSRPEIDLKPEELLGLFYVEQNGRFNMDSSIILTTEPEVPDAYGSIGPMQHIKSSFESSEMYEIKGRTFISKLEDPNLPDDKRVLTREESVGLKTPDGQPRPNACYYPDALYSAALRISNYKRGIYNNRPFGAIKEVIEWTNSNELSEYEKNLIRIQQAYSIYNSYNKACCGTWVPQMYVDIYRQHGDITQWSDLASSNVELLKKLSGGKTNGIPYNEGAGLVGSTSITVKNPNQPPDIHNSYTEYWHSLRHTVHSPHNYVFWGLNGGKWMYEGLLALGDAVGKPVGGGGNSNATETDGYLCPLDFDKFVVTSPFHEDRGYPHRGVDIDTGTGDPIYSPRDGVVTEARWDTASANGTKRKGGGKMVYVKFDNGVLCKVMHLSDWNVKKGDKVKKGDILGFTGNTGGSTGDHLHIELWQGDKEFDPTFLFKSKPITFLN